MATPGRVFILESPNPLDLLENRGERMALEQVCKLLRYDAATFLIRDANEFFQTCGYVSSIRGSKTDKTPLFIHISLHGNAHGICVGNQIISWACLAKHVRDMYDELQYYYGPVILILSTCGASDQQLTSELTTLLKKAAKKFVPPAFVFVFDEPSVSWVDAAVAWTAFYRKVIQADFADKMTIQNLLKQMNTFGFGKLKYFRWEGKEGCYKFFATPMPQKTKRRFRRLPPTASPA